jgi:hypothetical protein
MRSVLVHTALILGLGFAFIAPALQAGEKEPGKEKKDGKEGKKGTVIGMLVGKGTNYIEIKADGEETPRKYVPQWKGGKPADGGGLDKEILKAFDSLKVGSRVEVQWMFEERLRALSIKVLEAPKEKS